MKNFPGRKDAANRKKRIKGKFVTEEKYQDFLQENSNNINCASNKKYEKTSKKKYNFVKESELDLIAKENEIFKNYNLFVQNNFIQFLEDFQIYLRFYDYNIKSEFPPYIKGEK